MVSESKIEGVSLSLVGSIGGGVLGECPGETIGPLVGDVPAKVIKFFSEACAEDMAIGIWDHGIELIGGDGVFAPDVADAGLPLVGEFFGDPKFVEPTGVPVKGQRDIGAVLLVEGDSVELVPVCPIGIEFEVPVGGGGEGVTEDDILGDGEASGGVLVAVDGWDAEGAIGGGDGESVGLEIGLTCEVDGGGAVVGDAEVVHVVGVPL